MFSLRIGGFLGANQTALAMQSYMVIPRSPSHDPEPPARHIRRGYSEHRDELQEEAILGCNRYQIARLALYRTHTYATRGGFPGATQQMPAARMHHLCISHRARSLWAEQSAHIGRQGPLGARVPSERLDARLPSKWASFDGCFSRTRQAHTIVRAVPA